jgi:hypothetical protein
MATSSRFHTVAVIASEHVRFKKVCYISVYVLVANSTSLVELPLSGHDLASLSKAVAGNG